MARLHRTTGDALPEWFARQLPDLLDWDEDGFVDHFDALKRAARELGSPDATQRVAQQLVSDAEEQVRAVGYDLLAVAITPDDHTLVPQLVDAARSASAEVGEDLRWSIAHALSAADDERVLDVLLSYADDPDSDIRWQVARGIPTGLDLLPDRAVLVLLNLMTDEDATVRDWSTFALGVLHENDSSAIRDALVARLDDPGEDTAGEAAVALAKRGDPRVMPTIVDKLGNDDVGNLYVEAAREIADPDLLPLLERLQNNGWADDDNRPHVLAQAIAACQSALTSDPPRGR